MDPPSIFLSSIKIVFKLFFAAILADIIPEIPPPITNTSQCSCLWSYMSGSGCVGDLPRPADNLINGS